MNKVKGLPRYRPRFLGYFLIGEKRETESPAFGQVMENQDSKCLLDTAIGKLQETGTQYEAVNTKEVEEFGGYTEEVGTEFEGAMEDISPWLLQECMKDRGIPLEGSMEDLGIQSGACLDELGAQFQQCLEEVGVLFEGCVDDVKPQFEDCLGELSDQLEECMHELGARLSGCLGGPGAQSEGRMDHQEARPERREADIEDVGTRFERCIEEVEQLVQRRDELVEELLQLEQPMAQAVCALRAELEQVSRQLSRAEVERWNLQEEVRGVKRRLFTTVRDCTQCQFSLATQQHEMEQFTVSQEELKAQLLQLTEKVAQLQQAQQNQLNDLQTQLCGMGLASAHCDLSHGRQATQDLQHHLQSRMRALDERYEPRLLALLKRKRASEEALKRTREEAQRHRANLGPLMEEAQRLALQKAGLQDTIALMQRERTENLSQFRETLDSLEESSRKLKTQLQIQKKKNSEIETQKNSLMKKLDLYRGGVEVHRKPDPAKKEET